MTYHVFSAGKEAAVMPHEAARPSEVISIATVIYAGPVLVRLQDGRTFATIGGRGLNASGHLVEVTDEHRRAIDARKRDPDDAVR